MKNYMTFMKKEFFEGTKNYKLLVLAAVFMLLGIMNPLFAKFTPEILAMAMPEGMPFELPTPTAFDSWLQFFGNMTQIGMLIIVIVFGGIVSSEISRGTLVNLLTKGLSRTAVIMAKYTYIAVIWTFCTAVSFLLTRAYTAYFFPGEVVPNLFASVLMLWLFGVFLMALVLLASTIARKTSVGLLYTGGVIVVAAILNIFNAIRPYNPMSLAADNMAIIQGTKEISELYPAVIICILMTMLLVATSVTLFRKKQI